jgi:UDP-glucose 4-epimerase
MNTSKLHILVAGGAGYIGSVTAARLIRDGHRAVHPEARFVRGDISDESAVGEACREGIDVVLHFAAFIEVGESVADPLKYYGNNLARTIRFFELLRGNGVLRLVFSSTAAVYGNPASVPIREDAPLQPVNPYGWSKRVVEQALADCDRAYGMRSVSLRYFNAGGSYESFGESHYPESHLIPLILEAALRGKPVRIYGCDYPTRDGSCVRDYIHVQDLAGAHILAAEYLYRDGRSDCFNLGSGQGFTVLEVVDTAERIIGRLLERRIVERRPGDPPALVASPEKAQRILGWKRDFSGLDEIVASAYEWKRKFPDGYGANHD